MPPSAAAPSDDVLLRQAADWALTLQYDSPDTGQREAFERWRCLSPAHEAAWARAQAVFDTFGQVPGDLGKEALRRLDHPATRRRHLRLLTALLVAAPAGWLAWRLAPWQAWTADVATATGERKAIDLPDGSRLVLNSASVVDIAFTAAERRIRLVAGEILVTTHTDPRPAPRPFLVDTPHGSVQALGTRFSVRHLEAQGISRVAVFESAVEIRPLAGPARTLRAGEQADFGPDGVLGQPAPVDGSAALWEQGMLLAQDMRLGDVITELARHRVGVLRCAPEVAELRLSGAISLADTDAGLAMLEKTLPVRLQYRTRYWVVVQGR